MSKTKGKTLMQVFGEEREMIEQNLLAIQVIVERSQKAKETAILMSTKDANQIHELAGEIMLQLGIGP